ncbi:MAG: hydratase [Pseudomonadota bacterium]
MTRLTALAALAAFALPSAAFAACATDAEVASFVEDYVTKTPTKALGVNATMEEAFCTQAKVAAALEPHMGPVVGYKAGLTSDRAMEAFGVSEPVAGVLYRDMFLEDGATVTGPHGARPLFEADLILVVGSSAINSAETGADVMSAIASVHGFIELPDLMYAKDEPLTGATITAGGVGARAGVLGPAIPFEDGGAMIDLLAEMQVRVTDAEGTVLSEAPGAAVLGNPLRSVVWLRSTGITFKEGDMISVGSIGPLMPPAKAKGMAKVEYLGLPGNPSLTVTFN